MNPSQNDQGDYATLVYSASAPDRLSGVMYYAPVGGRDERQFQISDCGRACTLVIEETEASNRNAVDHVLLPEGQRALPWNSSEAAVADRQDPGASLTVTVMFYYTTAFKNKVAPSTPESKVAAIIAHTNAGYEMSVLNLRVRAHCIEELPSFAETVSPLDMITSFRGTKMGLINWLTGIQGIFLFAGTDKKTADIALLLISETYSGTCGIAYVSASSAGAYGLIMDPCYRETTGHEIGHIFGALHNPQNNTIGSPRDGKAYGHLMNRPDGSPSGFRTIMA